ncbi:MAG: VWA domain-containing protein [Proteobacteria bacterium]|nr:VWA domain-containing protein [Pseudomonadota bacterium]
MASRDRKLPSRSASAEVEMFLARVAATPATRAEGGRGRLIFAMDATASRAPTWDIACEIQGRMFEETAALGGLEIQLVFYRGFGECKHSKWVTDSRSLVRQMTRVHCLGGRTQIARMLRHAIDETKRRKVNALVFVGDCMEEDVDELCHLAGELGLLGVPVFVFHEGDEPIAAGAFRQIARLSKGAYCSFDMGSAGQLRALLSAVAVYAAGGRRALEDYGKRAGGAVLQITRQMK